MKDFDRLLTMYLSEYLPVQRAVSENTVSSYCTTFKLLIHYCREVEKIQERQLDFPSLTDDLVIRFLQWIEDERGCSISTRNQRLFALHSFFRYAQGQLPQYYMNFSKILNISKKKAPKPSIGYIDLDNMEKILSGPNLDKKSGRRDAALLSLMYDTGARVSEIVSLSVRDIRLDNPAKVHLLGKGSKFRDVPILPETKSLLHSYMRENNLLTPGKQDAPLFFNHSGGKLTRARVTYIVKKYTEEFTAVNNAAISPHILRHTKAMHLLQAGVNIVYIRDLLGHSDITTTEVYARADLKMKQSALEKVRSIAPAETPSWQQNPDLLVWLENFARGK